MDLGVSTEHSKPVRITIALVLLLLLLGQVNENVVSANTEPVFNPANEHHYDVVAVGAALTFEEARIQAGSMTHVGLPGHLVTITSQAEQDFINAAFGTHPDQPLQGQFYIGAFQPPPFENPGGPDPSGAGEGWEWVTGEPFVFTNWLSGEPNDCTCQGADEDIIELKNGFWNDIDSPLGGGFIVEFESAAAIPGLSQWGLIAMASILAGVFLWHMTRSEGLGRRREGGMA